MDSFRKIIGQKQEKNPMGNFKRFIDHVENGNLNGVMKCFHSDFLEKEYFSKRPIHLACWGGHLGVLKFLCENKCELDCQTEDGKTPVEVARKYGRKDCERYLNEIMISRHRNTFDCTRRNDVPAFSALYSPEILKMEENETGLSLLEVAVQSKANEIINYLLNKFVNDKEISTLGHYMRNCNRPEAAQLLQEFLLYRSIRFHHANGFYMSCNARTINEKEKLIKSSILEIAAEFGCKAFIDAILKKSIYNGKEWKKAKDLAIKKGHVEIAEAISEREILMRKRADKRFTWLHSAVCDNDPDMIQYILERQLVHPNFNNEVVGTALALAHMMCYKRCIEVLEKVEVYVNTQNKYAQSSSYATTLISIMTRDCLKTFITDDIFYLAKPDCDSELLMSLFVRSVSAVQQLVIENVLVHFALMDEYDNFINVLKIEIMRPKLFDNGETLLTSLLKKKYLTYCWAIINCTKNKKCIVLANNKNETPLQISIESDLFDLMNPLILNCDDESVLQFNWNDSLVQLFQKLSMRNNNDVDQKILAAIKTVIYRGGDIYKETPEGAVIITYCTKFKERIEIFQNNQRKQERFDKNLCSVCFDKRLNCAFDCGHTFCMDCGDKLFLCPMCNSDVTRRTKLYFN